jgi:hypothetical protein
MLKSSWTISHVSVDLKTNVSKISSISEMLVFNLSSTWLIAEDFSTFIHYDSFRSYILQLQYAITVMTGLPSVGLYCASYDLFVALTLYGKISVVVVNNAVLFSTSVFFYLQGVRQIEEIAKNVECMERKYGIESGHDKLYFGLVEVVYEWAQGKVSSYIKL